MKKKDTSHWNFITDRLHHELGKEEQSVFEAWVQEEENNRIYQRAERIHEGVNVLRGLNKELSWKSIRHAIRLTAFKRFAIRASKYAAVILIAFLIGDNFDYFRQYNKRTRYAEIEVLNGQMGHLFLLDGTEVWLNSGSRFRYPGQFNRDEREVFLTGEAFFNVAPDPHLPFIVKTGKMEVEVLGTSFNISAYQDETQQSVVLVEGKVQINSEDGEKLSELTPGYRAVMNIHSSAVQTEKVRTGLYTGWKEGKVVFDQEQLGEIAKKLERWYNVEIRFESEELKTYQVTGIILRNKPIDQTIMAIELLAPVQHEYIPRTNEKNIINIKKKSSMS